MEKTFAGPHKKKNYEQLSKLSRKITRRINYAKIVKLVKNDEKVGNNMQKRKKCDEK